MDRDPKSFIEGAHCFCKAANTVKQASTEYEEDEEDGGGTNDLFSRIAPWLLALGVGGLGGLYLGNRLTRLSNPHGRDGIIERFVNSNLPPGTRAYYKGDPGYELAKDIDYDTKRRAYHRIIDDHIVKPYLKKQTKIPVYNILEKSHAVKGLKNVSNKLYNNINQKFYERLLLENVTGANKVLDAVHNTYAKKTFDNNWYDRATRKPQFIPRFNPALDLKK